MLRKSRKLKQILWFITFWIGGFLGLTLVSYFIKALMTLAGLHV